MTVRWVLSGMKETPEDMARLLVAAMPHKIETLFQELKLL